MSEERHELSERLCVLAGNLDASAELSVDNDVYIYAAMFMNQIIGNYFLRMAAMYMLSIGSLMNKTKVVPRWLTIVTIVVGVCFLLFAGMLREARFVFPAWVFVVSVYILALNYRATKDGRGEVDRRNYG